MITSIKAENISAYKALFEEASDILSGYKRVRTYDKNVDQYYYKNANATSSEDLFLPVDNIGSLIDFASALANYNILYVESQDGPAEGYEPMVGITTLEEYFSWLKTLGAINRKYTVLPLGENYFEINANTRAINIPNDYKKNGVAVQSDDLAEVLYFRIDRYFDYMDLNNTDIFIQWETPKGPDGKTVKSVSPAYIRDIESEPGKLIFGWALSDMITAYAGALKFSIRFFQQENPEIAEQEGGEKVLAYSLSTLTATVDVKPSINLNLEKDEYKVDDCGDRLIERLENSVISGGYAAAVPNFVINVAEKADGYNLNAEGTYELLVQAFASDTGAINYVWKRQDLNEDNTTTNATILPVASVNKFVTADLANLNSAYAYYEQSGTDADGKPVYVRYTGIIPPTEEDIANGLILYSKQSCCVADNYGEYWAVAENRITNSVAHNESAKAKFPRPEYISIATQPAEKLILAADAEGELSGNLSVIINNNDGQLSYQWYKDTNKDAGFDEETANFVAMDGESAAALIATEEGHYKVEITNTRNKDSKSVYSKISRVTKHAETPIVEYPYDKNFTKTDLDTGVLFSIEIDPSVYYDFYEVEWYKDGVKDPIYRDRVSVGEYAVEFNPLEHIEPDENGVIHADGRYYPVVINNVNGSKKATEKITNEDDMFVLID